MTQQTSVSNDHTERLAELAIQRGLLSPAQLKNAHVRQAELARGGIKFSLPQTLLERQFITLEQFKLLMKEVKSNVAAAPPPQIGAPCRTFGHYEIKAVIAEKGVCRVLKARDKHMDRLVVLKVFPKALASNPQWYERFKREAIVAGKLFHPNIVVAYGVEEIENNPLIVMEYLDSCSLNDRLEHEGNLPENECWQIAREVAKGLAYAAEQSVIHRDIKPDNILCARNGRIKILDMGCAKILTESSALTLPGTTIGTPFYMSPEQAMGLQGLDPRTDIYSLGCSVYHMLTGSVPFLSEHCAQVMHKHVGAPRPDPRDVLPEISEHSAALVRRMMAIKPEHRPQTALELVEAIDALLLQLPEECAVVRPIRPVAASKIVPKKAHYPPAPKKIRAAALYERFKGFITWVLE